MSDPVEAVDNFPTALTKIRRLRSSTLAHQSKPATLLIAIESALSTTLNTSLPYTPTAYFASLLQCLEKAIQDEIPGGQDEDLAESENMGQGALIPATLYLLGVVIPETPSSVVLSKLSILVDCLLPLYQTALPHPPALRSLLQITTSILLLPPAQQLTSTLQLKKAWNYLLELNLDPRPKVRHLAQEGVRKVLTTPVPPRVVAGGHPYLARAREWVVGVLEEEAKAGGGSGKAKKARFAGAEEEEAGKKAIWAVQGLRGWVGVWGDEQLSSLCSLLLSLPPLPHLTPQIYSLLSHLLTPAPSSTLSPSPPLTNLPKILDSLLSSPPEIKASSPDLPAYLSALTSALIKLSLQDPLTTSTYLPKTFNLIFHTILLSPNAPPHVLTAASDAIGNTGIIRYCLTDEMILSSIEYARQGSLIEGARKKQKTPFVSRVVASLEGAFNTHALRMGYLLPILTALVSRLRLRLTEREQVEVDESGLGRTASEELLLGLVREIGDLRVDKVFEEKAKVDEVVGMAIEVMGVEAVLNGLPLNIEPNEDGTTPQPGRAHLLPLIRTRTTNDNLQYFTTYFRALSERIFARKVAAEEAGRAGEVKVWEVIVGQIWDCFPGFCEMPRDLKNGLTTPFLTLLTNLLYTQPLLLSPLLRGLSALITSSQRVANSTTISVELRKQFGVDQDVARENLEYLKTLAKDMVAVLLNVFSKLGRDQRGMVGDVIGNWVSIMSKEDLITTYQTVTTHLSTNLTNSQPPTSGASPISHTMLDLLIIFIPHLPSAQRDALFKATATDVMLEHNDATVQKKSYRVLKRCLEVHSGGVDLGGLIGTLGEVGAGVGAGAQRDRLQLLSTIVEVLPAEQMGLITELISEAVLGTKEVNEKARDAGFDLVVAMGHKMAKGGLVRREADDEEELAESSVEANVEEYITMVAAGLTGTTPHMISASINALSRLIFEFKDDITETTLSELLKTTTQFLLSKNREIIKSALGFTKVTLVVLPPHTISPHLPELVPALLGWVHDHKNHFKQKTIHIFERIMRRFGYDVVMGCVPEGMRGEGKVLEGIKRRKDRSRRKKNKGGDGEDGEGEDDEGGKKVKSGNAFEDVLYNSDSEDESDESGDEERGRPKKGLPRGKPGQGGAKVGQGGGAKGGERERRREKGQAYIRGDGDEPMDLLSRSIAGGISRSDPTSAKKGRTPGQDAKHFKTDKTGKLIIEDDTVEPSGQNNALDLEGGAFNAASRGVDGQTRDARGGIKFARNTKRAREEEMGLDLDEYMGVEKKSGGKKKKEGAARLGEEFRAKRAGGDIKKQGAVDPYSYVPIGQAARGQKGGRGGERVNLTNKKKGSRG